MVFNFVRYGIKFLRYGINFSQIWLVILSDMVDKFILFPQIWSTKRQMWLHYPYIFTDYLLVGIIKYWFVCIIIIF